MKRRSSIAQMAAVGLCLAFPPAASWGQTYPAKPITWVVGYPAGSGVDFLARTLSAKMASALGQPVVIENKAGAAGIIGAASGARAAPDGYTITSVGTGELVLNPLLYKKLSYDPRKDFVPVGAVAKNPFLLAVHTSLPAKSVPELLALARARPGAINYASGGLGHPNHLSMELLKQKFGVDLTQVPYKGMTNALQDFLAGTVSVMFIDLATAMAQMNTGRFRVLAVSTKERLDALPDVPSLSELGAQDYDVVSWHALAVPASTPAPVIRALNGALNEALKDPETARKMQDAGMRPLPGEPKAVDDMVRADHARWAPAIQAMNLSLD